MSVQVIPEDIGDLAPEVQATYDEAVRLSDKVVVDGKLDAAVTDETFEVVNPAWLNVIGSAPRCREADVDRAVSVAKKAFKPWSRVTAKERGALTHKLADIIEEHADDIARLEALENGNAYSTQARPELDITIEVLRMFAGFATELKGNTVPWINGTLHYTTRDPIGVGRRNYPLECTRLAVGLQDRSGHRGGQYGRREDRRAGSTRRAQVHGTGPAGPPRRRRQHDLRIR